MSMSSDGSKRVRPQSSNNRRTSVSTSFNFTGGLQINERDHANIVSYGHQDSASDAHLISQSSKASSVCRMAPTDTAVAKSKSRHPGCAESAHETMKERNSSGSRDRNVRDRLIPSRRRSSSKSSSSSSWSSQCSASISDTSAQLASNRSKGLRCLVGGPVESKEQVRSSLLSG